MALCVVCVIESYIGEGDAAPRRFFPFRGRVSALREPLPVGRERNRERHCTAEGRIGRELVARDGWVEGVFVDHYDCS